MVVVVVVGGQLHAAAVRCGYVKCFLSYHLLSFLMKLSNLILLGKSLFRTLSVNISGSKPNDTSSFCHHRASGSVLFSRRCISLSGNVNLSSILASSGPLSFGEVALLSPGSSMLLPSLGDVEPAESFASVPGSHGSACSSTAL